MSATELGKHIAANPDNVNKILSIPERFKRHAEKLAVALNVLQEELYKEIGAPIPPVTGMSDVAQTEIADAPFPIFDDDDAYAEVARMVAQMLTDAMLPNDPGAIAKETRRVWAAARSFGAPIPSLDRIEFVLSERRSALLAERAKRFRQPKNE